MSQNLITTHLDEIAAARRRTLRHDPEGLHDLRIALRGLRAILPILEIKKSDPVLYLDWQAMSHATGPARDVEVMLDLLQTHPEAAPNLIANLQKQAEQSRSQLIAYLSRPSIPLLIQHSRISLDRLLRRTKPAQLRQRAKQRGKKLYVQIHQRISTLSPATPAEEWHTLRLEIKRLRYLIELCKAWLNPEWMALTPQLKRCQSVLGDLHDIDMITALTGMPLLAERNARQKIAAEAVKQLAELLAKHAANFGKSG